MAVVPLSWQLPSTALPGVVRDCTRCWEGSRELKAAGDASYPCSVLPETCPSCLQSDHCILGKLCGRWKKNIVSAPALWSGRDLLPFRNCWWLLLWAPCPQPLQSSPSSQATRCRLRLEGRRWGGGGGRFTADHPGPWVSGIPEGTRRLG